MRCPDCGERCGSDMICSACKEELYILTYQDEGDVTFSHEFTQAAERQDAEAARLRAARRERMKTHESKTLLH